MQSRGEGAFLLHCKAYGLRPESEYRFHPKRRWKFDFYFPDEKLAVEVEGGGWVSGRHHRMEGFTADCVKYNAATLMGIRILRYTTEMVESGQAINQVMTMLNVPNGMLEK